MTRTAHRETEMRNLLCQCVFCCLARRLETGLAECDKVKTTWTRARRVLPQVECDDFGAEAGKRERRNLVDEVIQLMKQLDYSFFSSNPRYSFHINFEPFPSHQRGNAPISVAWMLCTQLQHLFADAPAFQARSPAAIVARPRESQRPTGRRHFSNALFQTHLYGPSSCRRAHHFFAFTSLSM